MTETENKSFNDLIRCYKRRIVQRFCNCVVTWRYLFPRKCIYFWIFTLYSRMKSLFESKNPLWKQLLKSGCNFKIWKAFVCFFAIIFMTLTSWPQIDINVDYLQSNRIIDAFNVIVIMKTKFEKEYVQFSIAIISWVILEWVNVGRL